MDFLSRKSSSLHWRQARVISQRTIRQGKECGFFEVGAAIVGDRAGLDLERKRVLNEGYKDIVELGNNLHPARVLPEDIEKVKAILGTDKKDPMWFLDYCNFRWTVWW